MILKSNGLNERKAGLVLYYVLLDKVIGFLETTIFHLIGVLDDVGNQLVYYL